MNGKVTPATRDALAAYLAENGLTLRQLGNQLGKSESYVSRYLNGKPEGDIAAFERKIENTLRNAKHKLAWDEIFFDTEAVSLCEREFDIVRRSSTMGLIYGAAGIGKSTACRKYARENPTVIFFTCFEGNGNYYDVLNGIATGIDMRKFNPKAQKKFAFVSERLNQSGRLILIDNAQRITTSGLRLLFDLWNDGKGPPVALVGNPEVLDKIRGNDQMTSRLIVRRDISNVVKGNWLNRAARDMVAAMWPDALADIERLACESARKDGHLRKLNYQLRLAIAMSERAEHAGNYEAIFLSARDYITGADASDE